MRFEPPRRVGADRMIRHHEGHKGQPISVSRNDVRRDVTALRLRQRLQRLTRRPLTLSRGRGDGSSGANGRERPRMADACRRARGLERGASGHPRGGSSRAGIRSAPAGVGALCLRGAGGTDGGGTAGLWLATRYIYRGVAHGEGPSGSPCHTASGLSSPVGPSPPPPPPPPPPNPQSSRARYSAWIVVSTVDFSHASPTHRPSGPRRAHFARGHPQRTLKIS